MTRTARTTTSRRRPSSRGRVARERYRSTEQTVILTTFALCPVVFWRAPLDAFGTPKVSVLLIGALALVAVAGLRAAEERRLLLPHGWPLWTALVFLASAVVTTAVAGPSGADLFGAYTRYAGLLPYAACVLMFLAVVRVGDLEWLGNLRRVGIGVLAVVVGYALLQTVGRDPLEWADVGLAGTFSTLGQENFASGFVACMSALSLAAALDARVPARGRAAAALLTVAAYVAIRATGSSQGYVAALAAAAAVVACVAVPRLHGARAQLLQRFPRLGRGALPVALVAAGGPVLAALVVRLGSETGERRMLWRAAWEMFLERPVAGWGFSGFSNHFPAFRPVEHATQWPSLFADDPHSVPLNLLASGGALLILPYAMFVGYIAWVLVTALVRTVEPDRRALLAGIGGVWVGYQVQAVVSFDLPPHALTHWIFSGAIVALARPIRVSEIALGSPRRSRDLPIVGYGAVAAAVIVLLVLVTRPIRADLAAASAGRLLRQTSMESLDEYRRAIDIAPWVSRYRSQYAAALVDAGRTRDALDAGVAAAEIDSGHTTTALAAADLADSIGERDIAERWFEGAVRRDPFNPQARRALGRFYVSIGRVDDGVEELRRAEDLGLALDPATLLEVAQGHSDAGDHAAAVEAARRAEEGLSATDFSLRMVVAEVMAAAGEVDAAAVQGRQAVDVAGTAEAWLWYGRLLLSLERPSAAVAALEEALDLHPGNEAIFAELERARAMAREPE